jgi:catechol 2,3-dioxygenase-like lactoylglutathione lyase family enzyme
MLTGQAIMAFLATQSPHRSREFYQNILGLELIADEPWALVFDSHGTMLRIQKVEHLKPHPFTSLGWSVPDIAGIVERLSSKGVEFVRYDFLPQDELGIWNSPSGARVAWFRDPDGNLLSLTQLVA